VHVFYGPVLGTLTTEDADVVVTGTTANQLGRNLIAIDLNSDGFGDVAMREGRCDGCRGTFHLFEGPFTNGEVSPQDAIGAVPNSWALAGGGDLTGDGVSDLVVYGMAEPLGAESVWVVPGPVSGPDILVDYAVTEIIGTRDPNNYNGAWFTILNDVNGDGVADLAATPQGDYQAGLMYGPIDGPVVSVSDDADLLFPEPLVRRRPVVSVGDTNGDGLTDFLIGSGWTRTTINLPLWWGDMKLVVGGTSQARHTWEGGDGLMIGGVIRAAGDVDGDGYDDFLFTVGSWDPRSGASWLIRGRPDFGPEGDSAQRNYLDTPDWSREASRFRNTELGAGDINGDGYSDIVISELNHGDAFIYYGMPMGPLGE
jgi:hypothetical protein